MSLLVSADVTTTCRICESESLENVWDLPNLPLTEKFGTYTGDENLYADQALLICDHCGHAQLKNQLDPRLLYSDAEYSFRTSLSASARRGTDFFLHYFRQHCPERKFACVLDVGGNSNFLAKQVTEAKRKAFVDPICKEIHASVHEGVEVYGDFVEEFDFKKYGMCPDLVFSRHVLEHISNPKDVLESLFQNTTEDAVFLFEIPCFDNLLESGRLDAVFHQHYHYYSIESFCELLNRAGGRYISHTYNRQGSCGGALLVLFDKLGTKNPVQPVRQLKKTPFKKALSLYENQLSVLKSTLTDFNGRIYGYGASLMLATLAYHLGDSFTNVEQILDDDLSKDMTSYENVNITIRHPSKITVPRDATFLITSLENMRPIFCKIVNSYQARRILTPIIM